MTAHSQLNAPQATQTVAPVITFGPIALPAPERGQDLHIRVSAPANGDDLPVILMTSLPGDDPLRVEAAQTAPILQKPFSARDFLALFSPQAAQ